MKILLTYFSATGNTAKIAGAVKEELEKLNAKVDVMDITAYKNRQQTVDMDNYDCAVFGFPVYASRAPRLCREWLQNLDGQGKKCSMFFTYGGFAVEPVHYTTREILSERNFVVVSSAQFLGAHTLNRGGWRAMVDRPDDSDFAIARDYAHKTYYRFSGVDPGQPSDFPKPTISNEKMDSMERQIFNMVKEAPNRGGKDCSMCGLCEELCPTGAMDMEAGCADINKCIACLRCLAVCPEEALQINDLEATWPKKLEKSATTEEEMLKQQSRIFL